MKRIYTKWQAGFVVMIMALLCFSACKTEKVLPAAEAVKDISGNWQVIKATRNGTDITNIADFTQFRLKFSEGKYSLVNKLPFLVTQDGAYSLDNPQYPFQITFTATGAKAVATAFTYPVVNGVRQLSLTFSPGCPNNTYVYVFQKVN